MPDLIELLLHQLRAAGFFCVRSFDNNRFPFLTEPLVAVGLTSEESTCDTVSRYLGQDMSGEECYGAALHATLRLDVYTSLKQNGICCQQTADRLHRLLLGGLEGVECGTVSVSEVRFDPKTDCFRCALTAQLTAPMRIRPAQHTFQRFPIKGDTI